MPLACFSLSSSPNTLSYSPSSFFTCLRSSHDICSLFHSLSFLPFSISAYCLPSPLSSYSPPSLLPCITPAYPIPTLLSFNRASSYYLFLSLSCFINLTFVPLLLVLYIAAHPFLLTFFTFVCYFLNIVTAFLHRSKS